MKQSLRQHSLLVLSSVVVLAAPAAMAQTAPADTSADGELQEVVVTGTRLAGNSIATPTPVQSITAETIEDRAPAAIADVVNQIPAFRITRSAAGSGRIADQQSGVASLLDLRGLDPVRTLVLINGQRTVGTTAQGTFDSNMIPVGLVDRVDVVTGGASAAYGSDAVSGVVNFVLKNKMEGLTGSVQTGITRYGDGAQNVGTLAGGFGFAEDRGHVIFGVDAAKTNEVGNIYTRPYGKDEPGLLTVSAAQRAALGLPAQYFTNGVELANATPGGLITQAASDGNYYAFDASGNPYAFDRGTVFGSGSTAVMTGSTANHGYDPNGAFRLQNPNDREVAYGRAEFEITPDATVYAEANYGRTHLPPQLTAFYTVVPITVSTASLPASIASLYTSPTVTMGRIFTENGGGNLTWQTNALNRFVLGAQGKVFEDWKWDISYEHGRTHQDFNTSGLVNSALTKAIGGCTTDTAASATYESLTGKTCVAFDPFGLQSGNTAALDYIYNNQHQDSYFGQDAAQASISGSPFTMWAGDAQLAAGVEWRRDSLEVVGTPEGVANLYSQGNFGGYSGSNNVKEGFAEVGLPLLKDLPGAKSLDLNGAIRRTDYKLGGAVTTWKGGLTFEPLDGLTLRVTKSRDIRAPNLNELYFVGGILPTPVTNAIPGTFGYNVAATSSVNGAGNPGLVPEKADTVTGGVVFQPMSGPMAGFRASVDYYTIKINGAIARLNTAQTQQACAAIIAAGGTTCPGITFSTTNANGIASITNMSQNLNALKASGIDIELGYRWNDLPFNTPGMVTVTALANHAIHDQQFLSTGVFELAGSMNGVPGWNGNLTMGYDNGGFGASWQLTGFTGVKYDVTTLYAGLGLLVDPSDPGYVNTNNNTININHFGGVVYSNLQAHYSLTKNFQVFGVVNNVFDRQPPMFAVIAATNGSRNLNYDLLGRAYKIGVRFNFN
ncbi:MAG TPA: TonB-dependent receptor [Steroidobacteraceae bacterium]|nr:TonB-dependent receptor [Steroidobacteraceae bacterium]